MRLDRPWIERNIPHHGRMCLLDEVMEWDAQHIRCRSGTHRLTDHPLRSQGRLGVACGIEYAAQAMAVHGALAGGALVDGASGGGACAGPLPGPAREGCFAGKSRSEVGFLASLRDVRLHVLRLDDIESDLICDALLVAGDHGSALYEFALTSEAERRRLLSGRATVVFDANERIRTSARFKT
jgi:predicted hotdog family 3-hydroxylacyl-ACP dehydratase